MNIYAIVAGTLALFAFIGHLTIGKVKYLKPMMTADFDHIAKKVMQSVFHYTSIFLFLSGYLLVVPGIRGGRCVIDPTPLFGFIGMNYLLFAIGQIIIALRAKISLLKMFQWIFWILISVFSFLAANVANSQ